MLVGMLKGPEALLTLRLEISSSISEEQVGREKNCLFGEKEVDSLKVIHLQMDFH